jgi:hypothetical protein
MCVCYFPSIRRFELMSVRSGASGTVTVEDQRSYIKIEILCGENPTEIHSVLREVCREQTVDHSTVSHWVTRFREGHVSINRDPKPGRSQNINR